MISDLMAFSTKRNELMFLISVRVPKSVSPLGRIDTFTSQRIEPWAMMASEISR